MKKVFSNIQCACRRERSTMDHLVRLEQEVRTAFTLGNHQVSIFFDLEKAYDMTRRGEMLQDMHTAGLRGYLPRYIEQFLKNRYFKVRLQHYTLKTYCQNNGVSQGSLLPVTLFALKINSIANLISNKHDSSLHCMYMIYI